MRNALILLGLVLPTLTAHAAVYKYTDANGRTIYTDKPRGEHDKAMALRPAKVSSDAEADIRKVRARTVSEAFEAEDAEREQERAKSQNEAQKRRQACNQLRDELENVRRAGGVYQRDAQGERQYLSNQDRAKYEADLTGLLSQRCS